MEQKVIYVFLLLDVFLSCIAKSLTLQVKSKLNKDSGASTAAGSSGGSLGGGPAKTHMMTVNLASSIHPRDPTGKSQTKVGVFFHKLLLNIFSQTLWDCGKVSLLGVVVLWGDCTFIPADWGSQQQICAILLFLKTFHYKND